MNYAKMDAGLAGVLKHPMSDDEVLRVSVRVARAPTTEEQSEFVRLGGRDADAKLPVLHADVSRDALQMLSQQPWVRLLSLSQRLKTS